MIGRTNVCGGATKKPKLQTKSITASGTYTPDSGYDGFSQVTATFDENEELEKLRKLIDGTATSFIVPSNLTKIKSYLCYQSEASSTLVSVNLGNVTEIEKYAFYENRAIEFVGEESDGVTYFPRKVSIIGAYALRYAGWNKRYTHSFVLHPTTLASIGDFAFYYGIISKVKGSFSNIGQYAFSKGIINEIDLTCTGDIGDAAFQDCGVVTSVKLICKNLGSNSLRNTCSDFTSLYLKINGSIGSFAFYCCQYIEDFTLDSASVVTAIGSSAFRGLGARRTGTDVFVLDFSKGSITTISTYAFDPADTSYPCHDMFIKLPSSVKTIESGAFRYLKNSVVDFSSDAPPKVSSTTSFSNWNNTYLTCPINSINAYRTQTNMAQIASYIRGKATGLSELPEINTEGYELTWYHDIACTDAVTKNDTIDSESTYYCIASAEKKAYMIMFSLLNCTIEPTANGRIYASGDMVRIGTVLTLNVTATDETKPLPYIQTINDVTFVSGDTYTVTDQDIIITALYWDEVNVPLNSTFAENSWAMIKVGCQLGLASQFWTVGDCKNVTMTDGRTYTVRIADMVENRYQYSDGTTGGTHAVFEFVELINVNGKTGFMMNSSNTNIGGFVSTEMKTIHLDQTIYSILPNDLKDCLEEIVVYSFSGGLSTTPIPANCKLFLTSRFEIFSSTYTNNEDIETQGKGRYQIYATNDTNTFRIKYLHGTSNKGFYWLRTPYLSTYAEGFCVVDSGNSGWASAHGEGRIAPCFAF